MSERDRMTNAKELRELVTRATSPYSKRQLTLAADTLEALSDDLRLIAKLVNVPFDKSPHPFWEDLSVRDKVEHAMNKLKANNA